MGDSKNAVAAAVISVASAVTGLSAPFSESVSSAINDNREQSGISEQVEQLADSRSSYSYSSDADDSDDDE